MFHISDDVDLKHAFESSMILFFIFYEKLEDFITQACNNTCSKF